MMPWGLASWIAAGLVIGILFRLAAPLWLTGVGVARGWLGSLFLGAGGALLGGLAATLLGFGGLVAYDPQSLALAALGALLVLLADRYLGAIAS